jgi:hypothetical protein
MVRHHLSKVAAVVAGFVALAANGARPVAEEPAAPGTSSGVVAHEWGTFTSVADDQGQPTEWLPLSGESDLPCFVNYYENRQVKVLVDLTIGPLANYRQARERLRGTVRMETPVIYFYATSDATVDVDVRFPQGLFSEWYPAATVSQLPAHERLLPVTKTVGSGMQWKGVRLLPSAEEQYPTESGKSHYYAARSTDSTPLEVGAQREKFLFYRGVGSFPVPIAATLAEEETVIVTNRGDRPIPGVVLFSRTGDSMSFRAFGTLEKQVGLTLPATAGTLDSLKGYLHQTLVSAGLFPREAQAMLETWGDSWFEEGTRVFYIVPPATVDSILPLTITPRPASIVRAFVGRVEVITPAMEATVLRAFLTADTEILDRYGRLIGPIGDRLIAKSTSAAERATITSMLTERLRAFAAAGGGC